MVGKGSVEVRERLTGRNKTGGRDYWLKQLDSISVSFIRLDADRPAAYSAAWEEVDFGLDPAICRKIAEVTDKDHFLMYAVLLAGLKVSLYRYSGTTKIVVGSPLVKTGGRITLNDAIPIITDIDASVSFQQYLRSVRSTLLKSYQYQDYPLSDLLDEAGLDEQPNKHPLFDVALQLTNVHDEPLNTNNDITIVLTEKKGAIAGTVRYQRSLFYAETIRHFADNYHRILAYALESMNAPLSDIVRRRDEGELKRIVEWNGTGQEYPRNRCVHQLFEDQAERASDAPALICNGAALTYGELNRRANKLAHHLRALGIGPDVPVGLFLDRTTEMIIGMLGVLKAGGAYVPIDPSYPKDRIDTMFRALKMPLLLTRAGLSGGLPRYDGTVFCIDRDWESIDDQSEDNPANQGSVSDTAYIIFTSGSTGTPKATAVHHQGWTNLLHWFSREFGLRSTDKVLVISSVSFDITQRSIAMPLVNGGELHLFTSEYFEPELISKMISDEQITIVNCAPSTFYPLVENRTDHAWRNLDSLRYVFLGGEAISPLRLLPWATSSRDRTAIVNVYGAAECSDVSTFYVLKEYERYTRSTVPIGKPIYNTKIHILDDRQKHVPIGAVGEIFIAGDGIGKGYVNDAELTAAKFIAARCADGEGELIYRTGDLGRYLPDGTIQYAGRTDHQVKIRGLRVELGDIESAIRLHPGVKEAVVVEKVLNKNDQRLVAYVMPSTGENGKDGRGNDRSLREDLNGYLREKLPRFLIPNFIVILPELPLNPNGKIDRKALQRNDISDVLKEHDGAEEKEVPLVSEVMRSFVDVLSADENDVHEDSNFFHAGGHSLLAVQLIASLNEKYGINLRTADLYIEPTAVGLARRIEKARAAAGQDMSGGCRAIPADCRTSADCRNVTT